MSEVRSANQPVVNVDSAVHATEEETALLQLPVQVVLRIAVGKVRLLRCMHSTFA